MSDDDFADLLEEFLRPPAGESDEAMADVRFDPRPGCGGATWGHGEDHALAKHGVVLSTIEEVLFEEPACEEKQSRKHPLRTLFWGTSRSGDTFVVCCLDETEDGVRTLSLVSAWPEDEKLWRSR